MQNAAGRYDQAADIGEQRLRPGGAKAMHRKADWRGEPLGDDRARTLCPFAVAQEEFGQREAAYWIGGL